MFIVLYRWQLEPEKEQLFMEGWSELVHRNVEQMGALGSRLHKGEDGLWYAYSEWPSRRHWEIAQQFDDYHIPARQKMLEAILRQYDALVLTPRLDHLIGQKLIPSQA